MNPIIAYMEKAQCTGSMHRGLNKLNKLTWIMVKFLFGCNKFMFVHSVATICLHVCHRMICHTMLVQGEEGGGAELNVTD